MFAVKLKKGPKQDEKGTAKWSLRTSLLVKTLLAFSTIIILYLVIFYTTLAIPSESSVASPKTDSPKTTTFIAAHFGPLVHKNMTPAQTVGKFFRKRWWVIFAVVTVLSIIMGVLFKFADFEAPSVLPNEEDSVVNTVVVDDKVEEEKEVNGGTIAAVVLLFVTLASVSIWACKRHYRSKGRDEVYPTEYAEENDEYPNLSKNDDYVEEVGVVSPKKTPENQNVPKKTPEKPKDLFSILKPNHDTPATDRVQCLRKFLAMIALARHCKSAVSDFGDDQPLIDDLADYKDPRAIREGDSIQIETASLRGFHKDWNDTQYEQFIDSVGARLKDVMIRNEVKFEENASLVDYIKSVLMTLDSDNTDTAIKLVNRVKIDTKQGKAVVQ